MTRTETLHAAYAAVSQRTAYGAPEDNFRQIAELWNAHLALPSLAPHDVALMMILLKVARLRADPSHADSWVDIAGYAACGAEVSHARNAEVRPHVDRASAAGAAAVFEALGVEDMGDA